MSRTVPLRCFCLFTAVLCAGVALAQENHVSSPTPAAPVTGAVHSAQSRSQEPAERFASWVHHVGSAGDSVVAVTVTATDERGQVVTRTGSGFVLRCDGFVVIPDELAPRGDRKFDAEISFAKMDGEELTAPLAPVGRPLYRYHKLPFVTLKVNDHHIPCLPVLNPANVRPGGTVLISWAVPDTEKPGRVRTFSRKAVVGAKIGREDRFYLQWTDGDRKDTPTPVVGATVTDEKGTAALGMISDIAATESGSGAEWTFTTFAHLDYICDEVGLYPSLTDVPGKTAVAATADGMVRVATRPVSVPPGIMGEYYARVYKTNVVCTPPFLIDRLPVTVGEYRAFLRRTPSARLPQRWELDFPSERERDIRRSDFPVTGAFYEDAVRYAKAQGKRLPTAVEWLEAAQGANTEWVARYVNDSLEAYRGIEGIYQRKIDHWFAELESVTRKRGAKKPVAVFVDTAMMRDLHRQQQAEQLKYFHTYAWPCALNAPVGIRQEDVSAFGVRDVVSNAPEMTIRNYARAPSGTAPKPFAAIADIYLSSIDYGVQMLATESQDEPPLAAGKHRVSDIDRDDESQIDYAFGLLLLAVGKFEFRAFASYVSQPLPGSGATDPVVGNLVLHIEAHPQNFPGFRCAK